MKQNNIHCSKYVALVAIFFIPLISNLLHYVIIEHQFGTRSHELEWVDGSKVHYCDQHLFKIHPAIEVPTFDIAFVFLIINKTIVLLKNEIVEQPSSCFYFNRGPPTRILC